MAISCKPAFTTTSDEPIKLALKREADFDLRGAREILEKIEISNALTFKISVEELLKITYRQNDWPSFFSYAQFYRKHWKASAMTEAGLLEPLALLRHCQTEPIEAFVSYYKKVRPDWSDTMNEVGALAKTRFKGKASEKKSMNVVSAHFDGEAFWKISAVDASSVHPAKIKIKVKNQCAF